MNPAVMPLGMQRDAFARSPFPAMPIAGTTAWTAIGIAGAPLPPVHLLRIAALAVRWKEMR